MVNTRALGTAAGGVPTGRRRHMADKDYEGPTLAVSNSQRYYYFNPLSPFMRTLSPVARVKSRDCTFNAASEVRI